MSSQSLPYCLGKDGNSVEIDLLALRWQLCTVPGNVLHGAVEDRAAHKGQLGSRFASGLFESWSPSSLGMVLTLLHFSSSP